MSVYDGMSNGIPNTFADRIQSKMVQFIDLFSFGASPLTSAESHRLITHTAIREIVDNSRKDKAKPVITLTGSLEKKKKKHLQSNQKVIQSVGSGISNMRNANWSINHSVYKHDTQQVYTLIGLAGEVCACVGSYIHLH